MEAKSFTLSADQPRAHLRPGSWTVVVAASASDARAPAAHRALKAVTLQGASGAEHPLVSGATLEVETAQDFSVRPPADWPADWRVRLLLAKRR